MITVTYNSVSYICTTALKGTNYIHLLDTGGEMIAAFDGVSDFSGFSISGGSWTTPTAADSCYIATIGDDGVIRKGGHTCSEIAGKQPTVTAGGILKGNGSGNISAAVAGTDYVGTSTIPAQNLVSVETTPTNNGEINWLYE